MPRMTKDETRRKLRRAVVSEAVEKGFGALSVSGVVNRAKASAGSVYVHFENKEDMLQKVFLEIKREFHAIMVQARSEPSSAAMIRRMWFDMFGFVAAHPSDFLFLEYGNSARILTDPQQAEVQQMDQDISRMLARGVDDGTLAPLDLGLISILLVAPATQLARSALLNDMAIPPELVETTFQRVWLSIAGEGQPLSADCLAQR